ncbi:site-specific DNA-methyltransferase [Alkalihalophilus lindianensis]|uniref:Site-specific DNA-methyltransferase n=1 Tax=Alkalihalophilus lindianensis TaxID=1630542 RepID=A0ABU3XF12_9BACI|nr:site-specific DNA-methyltransferase [Alkalihalophilus lindianensis]MDV2686486.1 site-specific DNA-methyltransferase [Alkalihalophilus lindianensis]
MKTTIEDRLVTLLKSLPMYWEDNQINKTKIYEAVLNYDEQLMKLLLSDDFIRSTYSKEIAGAVLFKQQEFIDYFRYKDFWDNSYTRYSNEIGLTSEGKYLKYNSDVVVDFPFKDTILEGGMKKEDVRKEEVFYHTVLAKEEIDIMLSPKIFTNTKKYDESGERTVSKIENMDNLIVKGNNLIALYSLKERYAEKVKLIYIDPPYNTGGDTFKYNDRFNHSTWLTFMRNRLEIAKDLLANDGSIWINIDDDESHYLKVLADEVFGRGNFINNVVWEKKYTNANDVKWLSDNHDHILVYAKNKEIWRPNPLPRTKEMNSAYKNPDNHPKGPWKATPLHAKSGSESSAKFTYTFKNGVKFTPPAGTFSRYSKETFQRMDENNEIWFGKNGKAIPSRKTFLSELKNEGTPAKTIWRFDEVGHNHEAREEIKALNLEEGFATPKPERLLKRIIHLGSNTGDIVLDFFMGSATTQAVSIKMNRQFIGVEQMDYISEVSIPRLKKVVDGEQGGISKEVNWQGGGSFVYAELLELNGAFIQEISKVSTGEALLDVVNKMEDKAYFNYKVELDKLLGEVLPDEELTLEEKKKLILESLDHNQSYIALTEIDDNSYGISNETRAFNYSFYSKETGDVNE